MALVASKNKHFALQRQQQDSIDALDSKLDTLTIGDLLSGVAKGDLLVFNGSSYVRLAVGTNGQQLEADSGEATGLKWAAAGGASFSYGMGFSAASATVAKGATNWLGVGNGNVTATQANGEFRMPVTGTVQNLRTYVSANATGGTSTITIKNITDATTGPQTSYASGVSGDASDLSTTIAVDAGDEIVIEVVNGNSGGGAQDIVVEMVSFEVA